VDRCLSKYVFLEGAKISGKELRKMKFLKHPILKQLGVRFITNDNGETEEIVFNFQRFQELWAEIEKFLTVEEEYEASEDDSIAPIVLERTERFAEGKSKGYTQKEVEKMFEVS
jgi:hypothetical protein